MRYVFHPDCLLGAILIAALVHLLPCMAGFPNRACASCPVECPPYRVSIFSVDGSPLGEFVVSDWDYWVNRVEVGPDDNVWVARAHVGSGDPPPPGDAVAVFALDGTPQRTVTGGGMEWPRGVSWDSDEYIYVTGRDIDDGRGYVFKYAPTGEYVTRFHTEGWEDSYAYHDIVTTQDDRIYVSAEHGGEGSDQMTEFRLSGETVSTFSPTGRTLVDCALSNANTIWVNGLFERAKREFNLDGSPVDSFTHEQMSLGLEVGPVGNLFIMLWDWDATLYELDHDGHIVGETDLSIPHEVEDFTFGPSGEILVLNAMSATPIEDTTLPSHGHARLSVTPNPFRGQIELNFALTHASGPVRISIYDVSGRLVHACAVTSPAGTTIWNARSLNGQPEAPGTYFIRLKTGGSTETRRVVLVN